jgi:hypothetical protein
LHFYAITKYLGLKAMPYPNPAGYYLPMPEQFENEITELEYLELAELLSNVSYSLIDADDITTNDLSQEADDWINRCSPEEIIALIRWMAERLDHLAKGTHHAES